MNALKPLPRFGDVPARNPRKIRRLPESKAVTIGVGFLCSDGIVLCADNQITWPQNHKYYETKIYQHGTEEWLVSFTYAGNPNLMKMFDGKFEDAMTAISTPLTVQKIQQLIETVLLLMDVLDGDPDGLHMLCGIAVPPMGLRLLKTEGKVVRQVGHDRSYSYVGVGDSSLLRYLGGLLIKGQDHNAEQGLTLGTYLVLQAKRYVDGCGGDTDAVILRPNAHLELRSGGTYNNEQHILHLEHAIGKVSEAFFDPEVSAGDFSDLVDALSTKVKEERSYRIKLCR